MIVISMKKTLVVSTSLFKNTVQWCIQNPFKHPRWALFYSEPFKRQPHKMAKHTQTIREFNPFHVTSFYLYPLKTPEKHINICFLMF